MRSVVLMRDVRFPRRVFTIADVTSATANGQSKSKTFEEMDLVGRQERFFVEKNMSIAVDSQTSPRNASNSFRISAKDESLSMMRARHLSRSKGNKNQVFCRMNGLKRKSNIYPPLTKYVELNQRMKP